MIGRMYLGRAGMYYDEIVVLQADSIVTSIDKFTRDALYINRWSFFIETLFRTQRSSLFKPVGRISSLIMNPQLIPGYAIHNHCVFSKTSASCNSSKTSESASQVSTYLQSVSLRPHYQPSSHEKKHSEPTQSTPASSPCSYRSPDHSSSPARTPRTPTSPSPARPC